MLGRELPRKGALWRVMEHNAALFWRENWAENRWELDFERQKDGVRKIRRDRVKPWLSEGADGDAQFMS